MTSVELTELGRYWQDELNLSRYSLNVRLDGRMKNKDGYVVWDESIPSIDIKIKKTLESRVAEETLVHELLHPLFQIDTHDEVIEGAFNVIARALVKNKYAN